jgi:putative transposase
MGVSDARRLKALEDENSKLKKLLAETMLDNAILNDIAAKKIVTPAAKRGAVAHAITTFSVSQRWARQVIGVERSSMRYRHRRPDDGLFGLGCVNWQPSGAVSATGACRSCFGAKGPT